MSGSIEAEGAIRKSFAPQPGETDAEREARWAARSAALFAALSPEQQAAQLARQAEREAERADKEARFARLRDEYMRRPAWVVLAWMSQENSPRGLIEHSFSMDWSSERVRMWWSGKGVDNVFGKTWKVDGRKDADHQRAYYAGRAGWRIDVFDTLDPACPIVVDREKWARSMSGIFGNDKFGARNAPFTLREDQ